jgi:transcriptional regulator with XRE-family HTH domain
MEKREKFGMFVADKRRAAGLSQRELANRLCVTESAVSKWERGISYPDITMIAPLSAALNVTDHELMTASDDREFAAVSATAESWNRQRRIVTLICAIGFGAALVACFVVQLALDHRLTWFFIVLAAILVAASLTVLPYWLKRDRLQLVTGAFTATVLILLIVCWLYTGGGRWIWAAMFGVVFGIAVVFGPLVVRAWDPSGWVGAHKTLTCAIADCVLLFGLVAVGMWTAGNLDKYFSTAIPIMGYALLFVWAVLLTILYLPINGPLKGSVVCALIAIWTFFGVLTEYMAGSPQHRLFGPFNLSSWDNAILIGNNVRLLTTIGLLIAAAILLVVGLYRQNRTGARL